ncbi:MAG: carboxypeptidase-like regulatory domain-containing protein [Kofleriaceae bacterium]
MSTRQPPPTPTDDNAIDLGDLAKGGAQVFTSADETRTQTLGQLSDARLARSYMFRRERSAATAPTPELDEAIANAEALATSFGAQRDLSSHPTPTPDPKQAIVHGFVRSSDNQPAKGLKVSLADAKGHTFATAATGADGYFELHYPIDERSARTLEVHVHHEKHPPVTEVELAPSKVVFVAIALD